MLNYMILSFFNHFMEIDIADTDCIIGPWMIYLSEKSKFRRKHPKYDDSIIISEFPKKRSIDSSFRSEQFLLTENTLHMDFDKTNFP